MSYLFETLSPNFVRNQRSMLDRDSVDLQEPTPGIFTGLTSADTYTNAAGTIEQEAKAVGGLALSQWPKAMDRVLDTGDTFQNLWMGAVVDPAITKRKALRLDPRTHGIAAQVVNGLATMVPEAITSGPLGVGVLSGISDTAEQIQEGKPLATASEFGAITGLSNAIGVAAPAALPVSQALKIPALAQRATTGAAINVALGIPERYTKHQILAEAGYPEQAEQWRWNDTTAMAIDAALGGGFGALAHLQAKPSEIDAALTANEARSIDSKAPGLPATPEVANAHTEAFYKAMESVLNDETVSATLPMSESPAFSPELIATAGNRMNRGDRQALEQQKADIEYKLSRFEEESALSGYTKQDFIEQARAEQPRAPARKIADIAEKMALESKQNDRTDLQTILDTISQKLSRDDEARAAHAELSRAEQTHLQENGFVRSGKTFMDLNDFSERSLPDARPNELSGSTDTRAPSQPLATREPDRDTTNSNEAAAENAQTARSVSPEIDAARQWINSHGDHALAWMDDDGNEQQTTLRDLLSEVDNDLIDLDKLEAATQAAITCFLKFGDTA